MLCIQICISLEAFKLHIDISFFQYNAQLEQQRLEQQQREKAERLKRFQEEVKKRVQALDRAKKQQALEKSFQAVSLL